jgi:RNA polymerase sigma-70 factor, ECF subfamily
MQNLGSFRRDRPGDTFHGWLWTIANSKIADCRRRASRSPQAAGGTEANLRWQELPESSHSETAVTGQIASSDLSQLVRRAAELVRSEFKPHNWQAFWLIVVENRPPQEVAEELGISIWSVHKAKTRVMARLRRELNDQD